MPIVVLVTGAGVVVAALLLSLLAAGGLPGTISTLAGSDIAGVQSSSVSPAATANAPIGAAPPQVEAVEPEDAALPPPSGAPAAEDQALDSSQSAALGADAKPTIAVATEAPPTPAPSTILAFTADRRPSPAWPSDQTSIAWFAPDGYHLFARQAQEFVAIGIMSDQPADAVVNARFQKLDGPPGGGYGIVVRDQGPGPRDGLNQGGQYYVLEVGDRGEVGIWRRDQDHWVDLVPWSPSAAVRPGTAENALTVTASGDRLSLAVNGTQVASISDAALHRGTVGVFVGGDQNHTLLKEITVERAD